MAMDGETRAFLEGMFEAMEARLNHSQQAMEARLIDSQQAMEARVMARINDNHETLLVRVRGCETSIAALTEIARSGNTTMAVVAATMTDIGRRLTDLERKG